jgi:hypothetical protein
VAGSVLSLRSLADAAPHASSTVATIAPATELNFTNLPVPILFTIRLREMSFTIDNGLCDLLFRLNPANCAFTIAVSPCLTGALRFPGTILVFEGNKSTTSLFY